MAPTWITTLPDGSHLVRLRESDAMLSARRKASQDKTIPRLDDITARLIEFTVTLTDQGGRSRTSQFRVLTTLLDHDSYPAAQVTAAVDLDVDPDEISFSVVLHAARDHLSRPCQACGHHSNSRDLTAGSSPDPATAPTATEPAPRTAKDRQIQHTRNVVYTIAITQPNLPKRDETP